ncbi:hypothetical protein GCM10009839_09760 [Catenulispora yoronensis]|uniref:Uncharacterized protein n=1 Tax=Catenulispora yoronensis TaxID=450799 RepID=A0ABN2TQD6_9ACTN
MLSPHLIGSLVVFFLRFDGPEDECFLCNQPQRYAVGESLIGGANHWILETTCSGCGHVWLTSGSGGVFRSLRAKFVELTGLWAATVPAETPSATPIMRAMRRYYGGTLADAKRRSDELRSQGLSGTRGEMLALQQCLADLGVPSVVDNLVPGSQTALPARCTPIPPHRIDQPVTQLLEVIPDVIAESERSDLAEYLRGATCVVAGGYCVDPITRHPLNRYADSMMTDGLYAWSIAWASLVERHGAGLPEDFLAHVRALGYRPPEISDQRLRAITAEVAPEP